MTEINISKAILNSDLSTEDLFNIVEAVKQKRVMLNKAAVRTISAGANVAWYSSKNDCTMRGTVVKTGTKNVIVNCGTSGNWKVPASMLFVA
jgi:hypothetical protein